MNSFSKFFFSFLLGKLLFELLLCLFLPLESNVLVNDVGAHGFSDESRILCLSRPPVFRKDAEFGSIESNEVIHLPIAEESVPLFC